MATEVSKLKNRVGSDDNCSSKEEENEKETGIDLGISLDKQSPGPKKKLLVLPLMGIIVYRAHRSFPSSIPRNRLPDFSYRKFLVYKRPFLEGFLKFCFERFEVGLWASAMEHNLQGVLTNVMGELKNKLLFTWDKKQCTDTGFMCLDYKKRPLILKELRYLWEKKYSYLPWRDGEYSSSNTLLITSPVKALLNPPNTSIFPEDYDPEHEEDDFLGPDGELRVFLDGLAEAKDVPTYVKNHPIGEPAITPLHSDWNYYSKIIRRFGKKETTESDSSRLKGLIRHFGKKETIESDSSTLRGLIRHFGKKETTESDSSRLKGPFNEPPRGGQVGNQLGYFHHKVKKSRFEHSWSYHKGQVGNQPTYFHHRVKRYSFEPSWPYHKSQVGNQPRYFHHRVKRSSFSFEHSWPYHKSQVDNQPVYFHHRAKRPRFEPSWPYHKGQVGNQPGYFYRRVKRFRFEPSWCYHKGQVGNRPGYFYHRMKRPRFEPY